jgi:hypothetical protein
VSGSSDLRVRLAGILDAVDEGALSRLLDEVLGATKQSHVEIACKHCSKRQRVEVPVADPIARAKGLAVLLDQGKGTPKATSVVRVDVSARSMHELSDEQLSAIAAGGSLGELPPAA